mmetsp:Transcript_42371/g.57864  ORF Transcript_42371/g.57864 Transcript_42371/m.57864 type:complete len:206 (-) Transcript_42371:515-1132(-)
MTSVVEIFPRVRKLMYDLQQQLREVEAKRLPPSDMQLGLEELTRQTVNLESLVEREVNRKDDWKAKIKEVRNQRDWLASQLHRWRSHHDRQALEEAEREELLGRVRSSLPASVIGAYDEEGKSWARSSDIAAQLVDGAGSALMELANQREMLKGTQKRVLDMLTTLGVSSSTIRIIERRNAVDKIIVFGGMALTSLCLYAMYRFI